MATAKSIQEIADKYHYWDAPVIQLDCDNFADEIVMAYDDEDSYKVVYNFVGCYKSVFDHAKNLDKLRPVKEMTIGQIPYFLHDIEISETMEENTEFYVCKIDMSPLDIEIWCKDIVIERQQK